MAKKTTSANPMLNPIAIAALVVSLCTMLTSVYQARLQRKQQYASVWPHLKIYTSTNIPNDSLFSVGVHVNNSGVGPAIIRKVTFKIAGKQMPNMQTTIDSLYAGFDPKTEGELNGQTNDLINPGDFIQAGQDVIWFETERIRKAHRKYGTQAEKLEIYIEYASIYGETWTVCMGCKSDEANHKRID
jgi:hypothetical protein